MDLFGLMIKGMFVIIGLVILVPMLLSVFVQTNQQHARIVETFGKFSSIRTAGLSFKLPAPIQSATQNISLQIREISVKVKVKASDNVFVTIPIRAQFRVDPNLVKEAYYELANPEEQIESYLVNQIRSSASAKTFDELYASKDGLETEAKEALSDRMSEFGYIIENVLVDDPEPSEEVKSAFDGVLASKRRLEAAKNDGEAVRVKAVAQAQADAEALELRGKALVKFRKEISHGNAEAIREFTNDTGLTEKDALAFIQNINEMEALTRVGETGGRVVYISAAARDAGADVQAGLVNGLPSPNEPKKTTRRLGERPAE